LLSNVLDGNYGSGVGSIKKRRKKRKAKGVSIVSMVKEEKDR
jgi:hypothetical protein